MERAASRTRAPEGRQQVAPAADGALATLVAASPRAMAQAHQLRANFGSAVLQREVTGQTQTDWKANAADLTRDRKRKKAFGEITQLIHAVIWNPGKPFHADKLEDALQTLRADAHYAKYLGAIDAVLQDLAGDAPLGQQGVEAWVLARLAQLFPENGGDFADPALRVLRRKILVNKMVELGYSANRMADNAPGLAQRGLLGGQWVGRGLCQEAAQAAGGNAREVSPRANGSAIDWNHYFNDTGANFKDTTWKQFFHGRCDTAGQPAIFAGNAAAFRALGLPLALTNDYLRYLGK